MLYYLVFLCAHREAPKSPQAKLGDFLERSGGGGRNRTAVYYGMRHISTVRSLLRIESANLAIFFVKAIYFSSPYHMYDSFKINAFPRSSYKFADSMIHTHYRK